MSRNRLTDEEFAQLRRLLSELQALVDRAAPPADTDLDARVEMMVAPFTSIAASGLYARFPDLKRYVVAESMLRLGWQRQRKERGVFWVRPPLAVTPAAPIPASAAPAT